MASNHIKQQNSKSKTPKVQKLLKILMRYF